MSAPRGVELEEDIALVIGHDDLVKGVGHDSVDGVLLGLGDGLALDGCSELAVDELADKVRDSLGVYSLRLGQGELELLLDLLDSECWPLGLLQVERLCVVGELLNEARSRVREIISFYPHGGAAAVFLDSRKYGAGTHLVRVDPDKVHLALELTSDRLEALDESDAAGIVGGNEDVCEGNAGLCVEGKVLGRDLVKKGDGVVGDKVCQGLAGEGAGEVVPALVEGLVHDHGGGSDASLGDGSGVVRDAEEVVVTVGLGEVVESSNVVGVRLVKVGDENDLVGSLELDVIVGGDCGDGRESLPGEDEQAHPKHELVIDLLKDVQDPNLPKVNALLHVADNAICFAGAGVVAWLALAEDLERAVVLRVKRTGQQERSETGKKQKIAAVPLTGSLLRLQRGKRERVTNNKSAGFPSFARTVR